MQGTPIGFSFGEVCAYNGGAKIVKRATLPICHFAQTCERSGRQPDLKDRLAFNVDLYRLFGGFVDLAI